MRKYRFATPVTCALWLVAMAACENEDLSIDQLQAESAASALDSGSTPRNYPPGNPHASDALDAGSSTPSVSMSPTGTLLCGGSPCACNNGVDDDGDGTVDGFDAECTGGLDDDESSFATGIPGDNRDPKWQDCFFDGNSGAGDDRCRYPTGCLTGELSQDDPACAVTEACRTNCLPLVPNGCDCFGCCSITLPGGGSTDVLLSDACSLENIGDAQACPVCVKSDACGNECGECELCPGKTEADLPASCHQDPPADEACDGQPSCSESEPCPSDLFCSLGCCIQAAPGPIIR
jgi:hypothetical protein